MYSKDNRKKRKVNISKLTLDDVIKMAVDYAHGKKTALSDQEFDKLAKQFGLRYDDILNFAEQLQAYEDDKASMSEGYSNEYKQTNKFHPENVRDLFAKHRAIKKYYPGREGGEVLLEMLRKRSDLVYFAMPKYDGWAVVLDDWTYEPRTKKAKPKTLYTRTKSSKNDPRCQRLLDNLNLEVRGNISAYIASGLANAEQLVEKGLLTHVPKVVVIGELLSSWTDPKANHRSDITRAYNSPKYSEELSFFGYGFYYVDSTPEGDCLRDITTLLDDNGNHVFEMNWDYVISGYDGNQYRSYLPSIMVSEAIKDPLCLQASGAEALGFANSYLDGNPENPAPYCDGLVVMAMPARWFKGDFYENAEWTAFKF